MTSANFVAVTAVIESDHQTFHTLALLNQTDKTLHIKNVGHETKSALSNAKMRYTLELTEFEPVGDEARHWYGTGSPIGVDNKSDVIMLTTVTAVM